MPHIGQECGTGGARCMYIPTMMGVRIKVKDATIRMISRGCLVDKPARSIFCGVDKLSLREGP
jgi:hypothetical protein